MSETAWSLHPQLLADTSPVGDLPLSRVLAIDDVDYPWLVLVPRRAGAVELADLGGDTVILMREIVQVSALLKDVTRCDKINVGAIGNVVPQLHVHIVARRKGDPQSSALSLVQTSAALRPFRFSLRFRSKGG